MRYIARIEKIDEDVEEEVTLLVEGLRLVCFAGVCPYSIKEGEMRSVSLTLAVFDDYIAAEAGSALPSVNRIGRGFSTRITGSLVGDVLDAGIKFQDEMFLSKFGYLDGKIISVKVDRIEAEFLID